MKEMSLREAQLFCLDILKDVHSFCEKNKIKYTLAYGTLLGAVRHKGFIPWDNDIDICMLREDYDRFIKSYTSPKYKIAFCDSACEYDCLIAYARVFDDKRTFSENSCWSKQNAGVWIDIFPLDNVPSNKEDFKKLYNDNLIKWKRIQRKRVQFNYLKDRKTWLPKIKLIARKLISINGFLGHKLQVDYIKNISSKYKHSNYYSQLAVMDNGPVEHYELKLLSNIKEIEFEGSFFYAVSEYSKMLSSIYGDYMKIPPKDKQIPHQSDIRFFWKE